MYQYRLKTFDRTGTGIAMTFQNWKSNQQIWKHTHGFIEIIYVLRGGGINIINDIPYPILTGDLYIINKGASHAFYASHEFVFYNLMFSFSVYTKNERRILKENDVFSSFFDAEKDEALQNRKIFLPQPHSDKIRLLFDQLHDELYHNRPAHRLQCKAYLTLIINEMCRSHAAFQNSTQKDGVSEGRNTLERILNFVNRNFLRELTLSEIAQTGNISHNYISEFFKHKTGIPLLRYINSLRIEKARHILSLYPELNVTEVASECGFSDSNYFTRIFHKLTDETPSQFRKRVQDKQPLNPA